jgi:hypothetical protein
MNNINTITGKTEKTVEIISMFTSLKKLNSNNFSADNVLLVFHKIKVV